MTNKRLNNTLARSLLELIDSGVYPANSRLSAERNLAK